jgi:hypothetical protein
MPIILTNFFKFYSFSYTSTIHFFKKVVYAAERHSNLALLSLGAYTLFKKV